MRIMAGVQASLSATHLCNLAAPQGQLKGTPEQMMQMTDHFCVKHSELHVNSYYLEYSTEVCQWTTVTFPTVYLWEKV